MSNKTARIVDDWFAIHNDDGEFGFHERFVPYSVIGPLHVASEGVIFATKPAIVAEAIRQHGSPERIAMVGGQGLPRWADRNWMGQLVGARQLLFVGDMDPVDLMIFAWLGAWIGPQSIAHLGVNEAYLAELRIDNLDGLTMSCAPSEKRSLSVLEEVLPNFREIVGPRCAKLLTEEKKIELDAVVSAKGTAAPLLLPAMKRLDVS